MKTEFDASWKNWISTNVNAGQDKDGIFKILLDEGYSFTAIAEEMNYRPNRPPWELKNPFDSAAKHPSAKHQEDSVQREFSGNNGRPISRSQLHIPNGERFESDKIDLHTIDNFLNAEECTRLISTIKSHLRPSSVSNYQVDSSVRTSKTCDLGVLDDAFIKDIDRRICSMMGISEAYSESIQGQYYEVGQEFKAHTDFFDPHEFETHCQTHGQRTYTVMIYLNDVEAGGETRFKRAGTAFKPVRGQAVIWNSLNPDGTTNMDSLHQAHPVEEGFKAVITKWFRTSCPEADVIKMFSKNLNERIPNYTRSGLTKIDMPKPLFETVRAFYHENRASQTEEHVDGGFIFDGQKHEDKTIQKRRTSSSMVNLSQELRSQVHDALKPLMEQWCGQLLEPTFVYGIREYHNGAVLKMHRDRVETHIISAIINVDQETGEDWPLVIEDNDYRLHHIMIKPGEVILYEGGRLLHGRPIMFEGKSFANMFCHFMPVGYVAPT